MNTFVIILTLLVCYVSASLFRNDVMEHEHWKLIPSTKCGVKRPHNRIVNGEYAKPGQFPWLAQIYITKKVDQFVCAGSLINNRYVITAAHCIKRNEKKIKKVRLGEYFANHERLECIGCKPRTYKVENITIHPEYTDSSFFNDIALIRLDEQVDYNLFIRPICLPMNDVLDENFIAEKVDIAGWGKDSSEDNSRLLKYVTLPMRDKCVCVNEYEMQLHEGQFCAGVANGGDSCDGDSGGPMIWSRKESFINKNYIIGIVSYGKLACGEGPAIYTNVIYYMKWILDNIYDEHASSEMESKEETEEWW